LLWGEPGKPPFGGEKVKTLNFGGKFNQVFPKKFSWGIKRAFQKSLFKKKNIFQIFKTERKNLCLGGFFFEFWGESPWGKNATDQINYCHL